MMRRTPMPRGQGFKRPERAPRAPIVYQPVQRSGVYAPTSDVVVAVPKGPAAKPGKRSQTAEEKLWIKAILSFGCVACWLDGLAGVPAEVHHILRGSVRMGHLYSLPLCANGPNGHHRNGPTARHPYKARFEAKYGTEQHLLNLLQRRLGFPLLLLESK